jgi:hypothetical protein
MAAPLSPAASLMPLTHSSATTSGTPPASPLTIHGYCDTPPDLILDRFERGDFESLRQLRGEYTLVHETADGVTIITSPVSASSRTSPPTPPFIPMCGGCPRAACCSFATASYGSTAAP